MQETFSALLPTPIGDLIICCDKNFVTELSFAEILQKNVSEQQTHLEVSEGNQNDLIRLASEQLREYFDGIRTKFDFPLRQNGTEFQQEVWTRLLEIPYSATTSYAKLATYKPLAIRAIAAANGKNKLAIVIPCHRVIGSSGKLVGYAGGLWRKQWLLQHEKNSAQLGQAEFDF